MRLIIQQYLGSLKERDELDAILPDLLTEIGFEVLTRPMRGTSQSGVDIAAVGPDSDDNNIKKLFLFTIKAGDLNRNDWNGGTSQAVRPSLDLIQDSYIPHRIPEQYKSLPIAICVCMGGSWSENVRDQWSGYIETHKSDNICFREWNGARLTDLLLTGVLRQELLPQQQRNDFQKAIAMSDQPDISFKFFKRLLRTLLLKNNITQKIKLTHMRQAYISLWVLYVWSRESGNIESPYASSELAILLAWQLAKPELYKKRRTKISKQIMLVLDQLLSLHLLIAKELIFEKVEPYASKAYAISAAVNSRSPVDVNLKLSDIFGRIALFGLWNHWLAQVSEDEKITNDYLASRNKAMGATIALANNNPALMSPICDDFAIEICLFMLLGQACNALPHISNFIEQIINRCHFSILSRGRYPIPTRNYSELIKHPLNKSDAYFTEMTRASILYPTLKFWSNFLNLDEPTRKLTALIEKELKHTTHQLWIPDSDTDEEIWIGEDTGQAITNIPMDNNPQEFYDFLDHIREHKKAFYNLSAISTGLWPMFLLACRHYRLPIPPHFWPSNSNSE